METFWIKNTLLPHDPEPIRCTKTCTRTPNSYIDLDTKRSPRKQSLTYEEEVCLKKWNTEISCR